MTDNEYGDDLVYENARNETYMRAMGDKEYPAAIVAPGNTLWTGSGRAVPHRPEPHPLIGRVGLVAPDPDADIPQSYYIGAWFHSGPDMQVFSWAARIAQTFYGATEAHNDGAPVAVRRTFEVDPRERITALDDDWIRQPVGESPFVRRTRLTVPAPPGRPAPPPAPAVDPAPLPQQPRPIPAQRGPRDEPPVRKPSGNTDRPAPARAAGAVLRSLKAPRSERLASVLATLQPDQYELVTWSATSPLVVQGHPGTGKTIIATHRVAFLANPDREPGPPLGRVLLVGPTRDYSHHVGAVVSALADRRVASVANLPYLMAELAGIDVPIGPMDGDAADVAWETGTLFLDAAALAGTAGMAGAIRETARGAQALWEMVQGNEVYGTKLTRSPARRRWIASMPPWREAVPQLRYLPAVTACVIAARGVNRARYGHLVVDEAQDIRPLEWMILQAVNAGGWTLLGDINQRRVDHSDDDWRVVGKRLGLGAREVKAGYRELDLGFRSTRQIMAFASGLLPLQERGVRSLQEGPEPVVVKTKPSALVRTVTDHAVELTERYPDGLVAVIDVESDRIAETLRAEGWVPCRIDNNWTCGDRKLYLRRPEEARGVEYDAVVVVEPDRFPRGQGQRRGVLYTSLTRANLELVVVHSGKFPRELRPAVRRPA